MVGGDEIHSELSLLLLDIYETFVLLLKVRQIRNDFFKLKFLPKNERTNSTLYTACRLVFVRFFEENEDTKKTFRN